MSIYVGTGRINYPAMRGPCPYGYHVPNSSEWLSIRSAGVTLGAWTTSGGSNFSTYLKMPFPGYRHYSNSSGAIQGTGTYGRYWCNNSYGTATSADMLSLTNSSIDTPGSSRAFGYPIRPIKDEPVVPTSSWTTIYDGSSTAPGAGIFWSSSSGLISISADGSTWYTIADKNLGATTVYNDGDTLSEANCGKYFQRGNNYPFAGIGQSITVASGQVDGSGYGPGNWYYNSTFRIAYSDWSSVKNDNLRGWKVGIVKADVKDICVGAGVDDYSPMQGPCPDGFHVAGVRSGTTLNERNTIRQVGVDLGAWTSDGTNVSKYLKIPQAGYISGSNGSKYTGMGRYCCDQMGAFRQISSSTSGSYSRHNATDGGSLRPFKDVPVVPDNTWTTLYAGTGNAGIFWNKGLGLISLSSNGTKWYTIADKNLGATKVWNDGDSLNADNCGFYYQPGNNYGFPYAGPSSTSTSQVDVSNYGPSYPYYSSTFIKRSSSPYPRGISSLYVPGTSVTTYSNLRGYYNNGQKKGNVKQVYVGTTPARPTYNPGIYWNKAKGLISISSDGKNWTTIADRNAGAKIVYNAGDTLNTDNAGNHYQWGNNYPFPYTGSVTTSTTRVNTTSYSRKNPYRGSTFIRTSASPYDRSTTQNRDLWGQTTNTLDARRGPCDNGFHVPTNTELSGLKTAMTGLGIITGGDWSKYLKIPMTGRRNNGGTIDLSGYFMMGSSSFGSSTSLSQIPCLRGNSSGDVISISDYAGDGIAIRPFKNEPVVPDNSRAVLYQPS